MKDATFRVPHTQYRQLLVRPTGNQHVSGEMPDIERDDAKRAIEREPEQLGRLDSAGTHIDLSVLRVVRDLKLRAEIRERVGLPQLPCVTCSGTAK